ncbi:hypothetical protein Pyn_23870 [Prunus yedoensis var. nudiflora]|uniref:Uncharacterized protein n=1 Tax=Prunus yedoensis var. nudiflora TaxID=2094558 RepID=A0A314UQZ3_PRUYE|nr:hypothetical protein Pyn_23870 [Prunus yedoensis var. nudiflora]
MQARGKRLRRRFSEWSRSKWEIESHPLSLRTAKPQARVLVLKTKVWCGVDRKGHLRAQTHLTSEADREA